MQNNKLVWSELDYLILNPEEYCKKKKKIERGLKMGRENHSPPMYYIDKCI